jgi:hypothetical protein
VPVARAGTQYLDGAGSGILSHCDHISGDVGIGFLVRDINKYAQASIEAKPLQDTCPGEIVTTYYMNTLLRVLNRTPHESLKDSYDIFVEEVKTGVRRWEMGSVLIKRFERGASLLSSAAVDG